jgi:hypothetical protein
MRYILVILSALVWVLAFPSPAFGDYAWITEYQRLQLRAGFDAFSTSDNYSTAGVLTALQSSGQSTTLGDRHFWVEPEYGLAEDWTLGLRAGFLSGSLDTAAGANVAAGSGLSDVRLSTKWRVAQSPLWTLETQIKFPTGTSRATTTDTLVTGEGNVDFWLKAHYGVKADAFFLSASPGVMLRTGGYSTALTLELAAQLFLQRAYMKVYGASILSLVEAALSPSTLTSHSLTGSGGSYARLAASPTGIHAGGSLGFLLSRDWRVEAGISHSIIGIRYPSFIAFTVNVLGLFDFREPDLRPKLRSVPFETTPQDI